MASLEQLEKQKQDLITSYTQILKDTSIPSSDKVQIIKDLSRAIANITDQINRMLPVQPTSKPLEGRTTGTTQGRNKANKEGEDGDAA
jgi:hypothetical protein